jgi:L-fuconolactonase
MARARRGGVVTRVVDTHVHLWNLDRGGGYPWLTPELGPLYRTFGPDELAAELTACGVDAAVLVQAEDSAIETEYLIDVKASYDVVAGVVGWVQLDDRPVAERQLEVYGDRLCGVRHLVHDDPRDDFLEQASVRDSLALLAAAGLSFDVPDAWPRLLGKLPALADALPSLTVVVDHLGKPPRGTSGFDVWAGALVEAAARPNVVAKVSGLQTPDQPYTKDALRPVLETALGAFGADRLMLGSDWPMTIAGDGYRPYWEVLSSLVAELSEVEQAALRHGTADRVYRLQER